MAKQLINPEYRELFLKKVEAVCQKRGISEGYIGCLVVKDADFVPNFRNGGDCRAATLKKWDSWLDEELARVQ